MKEISIRELHRRTGAWVRDARKYGSILIRKQPEKCHSLRQISIVTAKAEGFERIYSNDRHVLAASGSLGLEGINLITSRP